MNGARGGLRLIFALVVLFLTVGSVAADDSATTESALAAREYDPTAALTQAQAKETYTPAAYGTNAQLNTLQIRSVLAVAPFSLLPLEELIRPTIKLVTVAKGKSSATATGFDDMQLLDLLIMPWPNSEKTNFRWGIGPYLVFPTSTTNYSGNGAWEAGPALGAAYRGIAGLNLSGLMQQATSFAYTSRKSRAVNVLTFQPLLSYQLGGGWYLKSSDATWNFNLRHGGSTTIPISGGFGKVWALATGYAIDGSVSGEWMAYRRMAAQTAQTSVNFQLGLLLPGLSG